jgi:hypothetical protein
MVNDQLHALAALVPGNETPVPIWRKAGWASDPDCMQKNREKSLAPTGNRSLAFQPVAIPTELSRLQAIYIYIYMYFLPIFLISKRKEARITTLISIYSPLTPENSNSAARRDGRYETIQNTWYIYDMTRCLKSTKLNIF